MMWQQILKEHYSYEWKGIVDGRPIMLVDVQGEKVLFYLRTGSGGADVEGVSAENQIKGGQFAPFHGFYRNGWFIKPKGSRGGKYLKVARWLDENASKDWPTKELKIFSFNRQMEKEGAILTNGEHEAQTEIISIVKTNAEDVRRVVKRAFKAINTVETNARHPKEMEQMKLFIENMKQKKNPQNRYTLHTKKLLENYLKFKDLFNDRLSVFKDRFEKVQDKYDLDIELTHTLEKV